jgi:para-nitrobenzyl esterase
MSGPRLSRRWPVWLLVLVCLPVAADTAGPQVTANGERLTGAWEGAERNIASFKGVPFAAPPVEDLRWRAPQPNQPRPGVQQSTHFAPACMQGPHITNWYAGVAKEFGQSPDGVGKPNGVSEDCLYLNIWSPDLSPDAGLPVMVWVHGGSNKGGWSYEPNYIGDRLAAKGVVVVSIAYRLGPFGFFSHPALDNGPGEAVANFGWMDGVSALEWVKAHIRNFGGDPDNITAMGESSGAGNIGDTIVGEIAGQSLYRRVIVQSSGGALTRRKTLAEEQQAGQKIMAFLGIPEQQLTSQRLRQIPADDLVRATYEALPGHYFNTVIDDLTFVRKPIESYDSSAIAGVDLLIGTNADEQYMYLDEDTDGQDLDDWLLKNGGEAAAILKSKITDEKDIRGVLDRLGTARGMLCPSRYIAARVTAAGGRSWMYYFSRQRPGPGGEKLGVYHGTEIGYVFDQHEYWQSTDLIDEALTGVVMDYWVQFARSGNPNQPGRPPWPMYSAAEPRVMELGDHIGDIPPPDADLCLWLGPRR